jgi:integrase
MTTTILRTATVIVRHSVDCPDKAEGTGWKKCDCPKSLVIYDGATKKQVRVSAKTREWSKAEDLKKEYEDGWDPVKVELKALKAEKRRELVRIEDAVLLYIQDMATRLGDNGTCSMARSLFGHIDPETKAVLQGKGKGYLFDWLDSQPTRLEYISEIKPEHLTAWRASWKFKSDLTAAQRWTMVKGFFRFCEAHNWIGDSPCRKLASLKVKKGSRTAIFTDSQYEKIRDAVYAYSPENIPAATKKSWERRLLTFLELMRWSGADVVDCVLFEPTKLVDGVFSYKRKTGEQAVVPLPDHLLKLLARVPLEADSIGPEMPFRTDVALQSDCRNWARRLEMLFKLAGITAVKTDHRIRKPHVKMLRDTCAVWALRRGVSMYSVSKMLGHSNTRTTEKSYLPFVPELQKAHVEDASKALATIDNKKKSRKH